MALAEAIVHRYRAAMLPPGYEKELAALLGRMTDLARGNMTHPKMEFFGSYRSGFCKNGADADLNLSWFHGSFVLQGHPSYEHRASIYLDGFAKHAARAGYEGVKYVDARIPVVSFKDHILGLDCDVTITNCTAVENSKMLRLIHDRHPVIGVYVATVRTGRRQRRWSRRRRTASTRSR